MTNDHVLPRQGTSNAIRVLHYLGPVAVVIYFLAAKTVAICLLQRPSKHAGNRQRRFLASGLLLAIISTLVAEAVACTAQATRCPDWPNQQDVVVYLLVSTFVYASLAIGLLESRTTLWHPYFGAWLVALACEVPCLAMNAITPQIVHDFAPSVLALQATRIVLVLSLCVVGGVCVLDDRGRITKSAGETESLLPNGNGHATNPNTQTTYGALTEDAISKKDVHDESEDDPSDFDSDNEDPEQDKKFKEQQRKRLEESGNWLNYLMDFKIFIPMLWPYGNRFVQGCLAVVTTILVAERFLNVLIPRQLGLIADALAKRGGDEVMPWNLLGVWMLLFWLGSGAGLALVKSLAEIPVQQFSYKSIGSNAFRHIMTLSMDFHNEKNSGELIRAIDQGQNLQGLLEFVMFDCGPMFIDLIVALVYVYTLFDIYMTLILAAVGICYVWIGVKTTTWSLKRRRRFNAAWRTESKVQNEAISNWQTVSHFNRGAYECDQYRKSIDAFNAAEWSYYIAYYTGGSAQSVIMLGGRLAAMSLAVWRVAQRRATVGDFLTLTIYWRSIEGPLGQVSYSFRRVSQMLTDSERLLQLMKTKPTVAESPDAQPISISRGVVEFDSVDFAYDVRRQTLNGISFTAKPGQTIAFVGETGGGKSTMLKLLYRYYDVSGGAIRIDGQDIREVTLDSLRDSFGMVPQDPALFNTSLMQNIKYARLDATDEEVYEACRAAAIHDKIESFPDKYKSTVGERGVKLSGGELQRVSIARAILRQPKIVLLDEATSMIDAETESLIQTALKKLTVGRTTFIIAHRLSTIQHANLILVINDGRIVESGTHDELFRANGKYVALWSKQLSKDVKDVGSALDLRKGEGAKAGLPLDPRNEEDDGV